MRNPIADKVIDIKPSGIRKFFDIVQETEGAISLGVGEPDFDTPWHIRDEGIYSLEKGRTFYTSNAGLKELKEEVVNYLERTQGITYQAAGQVFITVGGSEAIDLAMRAMVNPGDEVLIPQPSYVSYEPCAILADAKPVIIELKAENEFRLTPEEVLEKVTDKTKILVLPFPNNPTGVAITKERLQAWVDYALKIGAVILYDAAYEAYINDDTLPHSIFECSGAEYCAIEFRSFSKNAGFTGLRLGYTVISKKLKLSDKSVHAMWARRHGTKYNGAPYIIQRAGEAVYSPEGNKQIKEQIATYMKNALFLKTALKDAGYTVYGGENAPYIWLKTPHGLSSWEFFDLLLNKARIVGTPGSGFGPNGEGFFRLTAFGTYENSVEAIERIRTL